jgi:hypothetical protein
VRKRGVERRNLHGNNVCACVSWKGEDSNLQLPRLLSCVLVHYCHYYHFLALPIATVFAFSLFAIESITFASLSCLLGQDISPAGRPAEQRQARSHATSRSESNTPRIPSSASSFPTASLPGSENIHCQLTRSLCLPSHTLLSLGTSSPEFLLRSQSITTHQYAAFNTHSRYSRNRLPWRQRYQPETFRQRGATRGPTPHPTPRRHHKSYTTRPQSSPQEAVIGQERSRRA